MKALLGLAQSDRERELIRYSVFKASGVSSTTARKSFGFEQMNHRAKCVESALEEARCIHEAVEDLARTQDKALLLAMGFIWADSESESVSDCMSDDPLTPNGTAPHPSGNPTGTAPQQSGNPTDLTPQSRDDHSRDDLTPQSRDDHSRDDLTPQSRDDHSRDDLTPQSRDDHSRDDLTPQSRDDHSRDDLTPPSRDDPSRDDLTPQSRDDHSRDDLSPQSRDDHSRDDLTPQSRDVDNGTFDDMSFADIGVHSKWNFFELVTEVEARLETKLAATLFDTLYSKMESTATTDGEKHQLQQSYRAFLASDMAEESRIANMINGDVVTDSESEDPEGLVGEYRHSVLS